MSRKAISKKALRITRPSPARLVLRVTLRHIKPLIWRELNVPDSYSLLKLHRCIQLVFEWLDYHLFEFQIGTRRFEATDPEAKGEPAELMRLLDLELKVQSSFLYLYDMGDYWEHDIVVRSIAPMAAAETQDRCAYLIDGARAAPPEDVGGPHGYERAIAALAQGAQGDDEEDIIRWLGSDFDPELFDLRAGNHALVLATAWGLI